MDRIFSNCAKRPCQPPLPVQTFAKQKLSSTSSETGISSPSVRRRKGRSGTTFRTPCWTRSSTRQSLITTRWAIGCELIHLTSQKSSPHSTSTTLTVRAIPSFNTQHQDKMHIICRLRHILTAEMQAPPSSTLETIWCTFCPQHQSLIY